MRRHGFALAFICAVLATPVLTLLIWCLDPERVPLEFALPLFGEMFQTHFWKAALGLGAVILAIAAIHPRLRRQHATALAKQLQTRRTVYETQVTFSDEAVLSRQNGLVNRFDWAAFSEIERGATHVFFWLRNGEPLLIPKRALDAAQREHLDQLIARHAEPAKEERR